ncbi:Gfo/Idh/MocA family protein [Paraburkholderia sp. DHOC27]|uniref:Gfo/Idh/MocA family protein n=1 Tax=Paraburkholderia sp. DHOC27 TaxID=2303330 RepID=UPI000E3C6D52|nr:Gfo/Idh/MocA family oxidoreductase [Paraburkholderia sp. DHOC27]RFU49056.1 gfo/Idh/MocA family oxidoreductase [Paraburkholderia sp. DHOC27]
MTNPRTKIGIIGCGDVLDMYMSSSHAFPTIEVAALVDTDPVNLKARSEQFGIPGMSLDTLLGRDDIEFLINLTPPAAHAAISERAFAAGKHVYSEKPLGVTLEEAKRIVASAQRYGRKLAGAPDTLLGAAHRKCRQLLAEGAIGEIVSASAVFMTHGMEHWHPSPNNYFQPGGGPVFDIGPYYIAALVCMLGPIQSVSAISSTGFAQRTVSAQGRNHGQVIQVGTPTTYHALLDFRSGAKASLSMSWDVWHHGRGAPIEVYGTLGTLVVPDPNMFGGTPILRDRHGQETPFDTSQLLLGAPHWKVKDKYRLDKEVTLTNYRMAGAADLVDAVRMDREPFTSPTLVLHVLDAMESILVSARQQQPLMLSTADVALPRMPSEDDIARIVGN